MVDERRRTHIQNSLLDWYRASHRDLPWRNTRDPYRILVSEVMLQQTQAERVVPKYEEFLRLFPTLQSLADAPASEVIRAWAGLGYNRRALNLHRACREVVERFGGVMPRDVADLQSLPGIGPYTSGAIACFAYGADVAFIDTNIRRVLHRVEYGPEYPSETSAPPASIQASAEALLPAGNGYEWNQALMELGATLCRARQVACERCPLHSLCLARPSIALVLSELPRKRLPVAERFEHSSRYTRGRIIEALRGAPQQGLSLLEIGQALHSQPANVDGSWLLAHLTGLMNDGLVVRVGPHAVHEDSPSYDGEAEAVDWVARYTLPN